MKTLTRTEAAEMLGVDVERIWKEATYIAQDGDDKWYAYKPGIFFFNPTKQWEADGAESFICVGEPCDDYSKQVYRIEGE